MNVRLTADADGFNAAIDGARNSLSDFAIEERSLEAQQEVLNRAIAVNSDKMELLGTKCTVLSQKIADQKQKIQQATTKYGENSSQVIRLKEGLVRLETQYNSQNEKLEKAQAQSGKLAKQLSDVRLKESELAEKVKNTNDTLEQQQKEFAQTAVQGGNLGNQLKSKFLMLKGLAVGYAGKTLFNALIGSNAEYEQSMTSFEVLLQSADKADKLMSEMTEFAAKTPFEMSDLQKGAQTLLAFGTSEDEVIEKMRQLGDLSQGMPDKFERITSAYGKMNAKGKVSLEELNMLTEAGVPILRQLAEQSGISQEQLFKNISDGELRIEDINKAIEELTAEGGQFFGMMEKQSETMSGMWSNLTDNVNIFAREVGEETFDVLKNELSELLNTIDNMSDSSELSDMAREWGQNIAWFAEKIIDLINVLYNMKDVLIAGYIGIKTYKTAIGSLAVITGVITNVKVLTGFFTALHTAMKAGVSIQTIYQALVKKNVTAQESLATALGLTVTAEGTYTTATGVATAETTALTAAVNSNGFTALLSAILAVVSVMVTYNMLAKNSVKEVSEQNKQLEELKQSYDRLNNSITESINESNAQLNIVEKQIPRLEELADKTNRTSEENDELDNIIGNLNKAMPDLKLAIDDETGALNRQINTIWGAVDAYRALAKAKAAEQYIVEAEKNKLAAQKIKDEETEKSKEITYTSDGTPVFYTDSSKYNAISKEAQAQIKQYEKDAEYYTNIYDSAMQEVAEINRRTGMNFGVDTSNKSDILNTSTSSESKSKSTGSKSSTDALKKETERIKALFEEQERYYQMGWISEGEYWNNVIALRDRYYQKGSDDWWSWTLKIQKQNETNHKNYKDMLEKEFEEYLSISSDYISKCENDGWGTDSEISAYQRRSEKIKKFQAEFLENQQLTADERNALWIKANDELYQNSQKLKQALKTDLSVKNQNSLNYIEERTYFNDWQNVWDTPTLAFERIKERNQAALNEGYISYEEYAENLYEIGQKLYDGRLDNSYDWLEHEKKYNGLSAQDYISGLERMRVYTQEYYELGIIDYRKYYEEMQNINDDIFDANADLIDDMFDDGNSAYEELKKAFSEIENQLSDTWSHDDRINDINRTFKELDEFKGAVTVAGQDKYEQLSKELLSLQREEELYNLQQDNNKILA